MTAVQVVPAAVDRWPEVSRVFGPRESACWCQRFRQHGSADNRAALRRETLDAEVPVGLLALRDEEPVGWTRVVPRATLPGITGNRALARVLDDDPGAWWVACVVVRRPHRGTGVGAALLDAAVDWAARHGASALEGHPVDTRGLTGAPSPSAVFTGTLRMFERAGFTEVGRTYRTRPVVRRALTGPDAADLRRPAD